MARSEHHQERHGRRPMIDRPIPNENLEEKIRQRAYELYEQRNGAEGDAEADWYQAEAEVVQSNSEREH